MDGRPPDVKFMEDKDEIQRLRIALAESQARCARLEGALDDIWERSSLGEGHFRALVLVARDAWDRAMDPALSSDPSPLEAVRDAINLIEEEWGKDSSTAQALRAAFGLGGGDDRLHGG